jgi:probable DNA metabolism protein
MRFSQNFMHYLSAHERCTERLLFKARGMTARDLELSADPQLIKIRNMAWDVQREIYRMKGFVRLAPMGKAAMYGFMKPRHRIGMEVCRHLAKRSPGTLIILGNPSESWSALFTGKEILSSQGESLKRSLEDLRSALKENGFGDVKEDGLEDNGSETDRIWEVYYSCQFCQDRKNPKVFAMRMPKNALASTGLRVEEKAGITTLDDFFLASL